MLDRILWEHLARGCSAIVAVALAWGFWIYVDSRRLG